jgi:GGDEF domain-containing protein
MRAVTERTLNCVGDGDTVARLGGDEFAVIQLAVGHQDQSAALAN